MATVGKDIADKIIVGNGYYADDTRVERIVEYTNMDGKQAYGVEYPHQLGKYEASAYIRNPRVYWEAKD